MSNARAVAWLAFAAAVLEVWLWHPHWEYIDAAPRRTARPKRMRRTPPVRE